MDWNDYRMRCVELLIAVHNGDLAGDDACHRIHELANRRHETGTAEFMCGAIFERETNPDTFRATIEKLETCEDEDDFLAWYNAQPETVLPTWLRRLFGYED